MFVAGSSRLFDYCSFNFSPPIYFRFQEDYEYATNESVVYETIDDANISTASFQPNLNDDETMESTLSSDIESFDCTECDEMHADQKSLDAHLRIVSSCPVKIG